MKLSKLILTGIFANIFLININLWCLTSAYHTHPKEEGSLKKNFFAGILLGSYHIKDDRFERIYRKKRSILGIEVIYELYKKHKYIIEGAFSFKFYSTDGYSTITGDYTKFSLRPYVLNFRTKYKLSEFFNPFTGFGLDYYSYKEECPTLKTTQGSKMGYHIEIGGCLEIPKLEKFGIRGYLRYSVVNAEENNIKVELGGVEFGMGIFYKFSI